MTVVYYDKSKILPERVEFDFYPTPHKFVEAAIDRLNFAPTRALDPGCGTGVWGFEVKNKFPFSYVMGVDIRPVPLTSFMLALSDLETNIDYCTWETDKKFDLIVGNPPYKFAKQFIDKSFKLLVNGGILYFLLKISFLESKSRFNNYYNVGLNPKEVLVSTRRINFYQKAGSSSADCHAMFKWQKGYTGKTILDWIDWDE